MNNKQIIEDAFLSQGINPAQLSAVIPGLDFQFNAGIPSPDKFPALVDKISVSVSVKETEAFISMRATEFLWLLKETRRIKTVFCPCCRSSHVCKNGANYKFKKKYICLNPDCSRTSFNV